MVAHLRLLLPLGGTLVLAPVAAFGIGGGYSFEFAQAEFKLPYDGPKTRIEWPAHRITILDTSGALATLFASAASTDIEKTETRSEFRTTTTETWTANYRPQSAGIRVALSYAWSGAEVESQPEGKPVEESKVDFGEFRLQLGGLLPLNPVYFDIDIMDFIWRDMTGPARIDRFVWGFNMEVGAMFGPLRAGLLTEFDLISAVDAAFEDTDMAWTWGVGVHFDLKPIILSTRWRNFTMATDGDGGYATGRSLMGGASIEF